MRIGGPCPYRRQKILLPATSISAVWNSSARLDLAPTSELTEAAVTKVRRCILDSLDFAIQTNGGARETSSVLGNQARASNHRNGCPHWASVSWTASRITPTTASGAVYIGL